MEDAYWKRAPGHARVKTQATRWQPSPAARTAEYRERRRAFIVYRPIEVQGLADVVAYLIDENGGMLYSHICSHPHYAYGDLWARRSTRHHDHPTLMVDPHSYSVKEFAERYPEIFRAVADAFQKKVGLE